MTCLENIEQDTVHEKMKLFRFRRYAAKIQKIAAIIGKVDNSVVGIEGYSLGGMGTSATSMLCELGGCLRMQLCELGQPIYEIPPTSIKKIFSKSGKADKDVMYKAFKGIYGLPDIHPMANLVEAKYKHVPCPINDIVDSFAVALLLIWIQ